MKKWEVKMINVGQQTDVEKELNEEGQQGWRFAHALATPFGVKFLLERQIDEDVAVNTNDELLKKWS